MEIPSKETEILGFTAKPLQPLRHKQDIWQELLLCMLGHIQYEDISREVNSCWKFTSTPRGTIKEDCSSNNHFRKSNQLPRGNIRF